MGFVNIFDWYPWPWVSSSCTRMLSFVVIGSLLLHIGVKLPNDPLRAAGTARGRGRPHEIRDTAEPVAHSDAGDIPPPSTTGLSRRGLLFATGAGVAVSS